MQWELSGATYFLRMSDMRGAAFEEGSPVCKGTKQRGLANRIYICVYTGYKSANIPMRWDGNMTDRKAMQGSKLFSTRHAISDKG